MELLTPVQALTRRFVLPDEAIVASPEGPDELLIQRRGCRIGDVRILVSRETFGELIPREDICALPNVASWCLGLVNIRGNLVPAFDLHVLTGTAGSGKENWLLVLGQGPAAAAVTIDELPSQLLLRPEEHVEDVSDAPAVFAGHVAGAFRHDGELWLELDYQSLFESLAIQVGDAAA